MVLLGEILEEREHALALPAGHTKLLPLIETGAAVSRIDEIAACARVVAIACGDEDLAADLACAPDSDTLAAVKYGLVLGCGLQGVRPLGLVGSIAEYRDMEKYSLSVERSNAAGLKGTLCIHPDQVVIANRGFAPSEALLEYARVVVSAAETARRSGVGAAGLDGKMIDTPVLRRAENILKAAERYAQ